jgi:uncharacterized protein involved in exopolysaccharide biosynthesis
MQHRAAAADSDEIDLHELVRHLGEGKWTIGMIAAAFCVVAVIYAFVVTPVFRSEALVQPQEEQDAKGGLGSLIGQFGGIADLAGVSLSTGSDRAVAIATLQSRVVVEAFIRDRGLLPKLYPSRWNAEAAAWEDPDDVPSTWEAYNDFTEDILVLTDDTSTGLVEVAIEWRDPQEAQEWASELVARANAHLRARAIAEGEKNLAYLQAQIRTIGQVELQQVLYGLVQTELQKLMLAKGSEEFALKTIDSAVVPMKSERPKRLLVIAVGTLLGVLIGALVVIMRRWWRRPDASMTGA